MCLEYPPRTLKPDDEWRKGWKFMERHQNGDRVFFRSPILSKKGLGLDYVHDTVYEAVKRELKANVGTAQWGYTSGFHICRREDDAFSLGIGLGWMDADNGNPSVIVIPVWYSRIRLIGWQDSFVGEDVISVVADRILIPSNPERKPPYDAQ